jgi:hypothetical protein
MKNETRLSASGGKHACPPPAGKTNKESHRLFFVFREFIDKIYSLL